MIDESIKDLLAGLTSPDPSAAWSEFLRRYAATILKIVRRYESDPQRANECFDDVCRALNDDRFRRVLKFRANGPASFRTWLMAVTANLCVDWRRKTRGRFRPIRAVAHLPELDQVVYRHIFVRGMTRSECLRQLSPTFPELTEQQLSDINARLFTLLTSQQRWYLGSRLATAGPSFDCVTGEFAEEAFQSVDSDAGPADVAESDQERNRLAAALAQLPVQQRLLVRLRYEQNLTLAEVARLTGLQDPFRAKRQIQAALEGLAAIMKGTARASGRKKP